MDGPTNNQKVVVIGAGPVGSLAALYAAARGDDVHIYELRNDLRDPSTTPLNFTRSINLALSERGVNSLRISGNDDLLSNIINESIPMYGRMIHGAKPNGELYEESQAYDAQGRSIKAIDRSDLNKRLLDALAKLPNITFHFNHKLTGADFNRKIAWFEQSAQTWLTPNECYPQHIDPQRLHKRLVEIEVNFDLLIGADGAYSAARYHMMKYARVTYEQEYIDTLWCEFQIPASHLRDLPDNKTAARRSNFVISPNHLHIWPAGSSMFIAIPSLDGSFTCTLFAPSDHFEYLSADPSTNIVAYFRKRFPGVSPNLISIPNLVEQYRSNPHLPLISIKCRPYHYKSAVVILGDAAHAMVPFYGQGMNAGLEDVRVLFKVMDQHVYTGSNFTLAERDQAREAALDAYTKQRAPDAAAICDLAMGNYEEMRSGVKSPVYKLRKRMEELLFVYVPNLGWRTQYTRVSFENQRYSEVIQEVRRQGHILFGVLGMSVIAILATGLYGLRGLGELV